VIPLLSYPDVSAAAAWLCHVFGFSERLRIGIQLSVGQGSIVVADLAGRAWTFSQSEANVDPADWAGILGSGAET
jgi:uncharacterized glyoxalase superfamily protein PhnB